MTLLRDIVLHLLTSLIVFGTPYGVFELRFVAVFEELGETGPVEDGESRPKMNLEPIRRIGDFRPANYTFHVDQLLSRPACRQARALQLSSRTNFFASLSQPTMERDALISRCDRRSAALVTKTPICPAKPVGACASGASATANFSSPPHFLYAIDTVKNPIRYALELWA